MQLLLYYCPKTLEPSSESSTALSCHWELYRRQEKWLFCVCSIFHFIYFQYIFQSWQSLISSQNVDTMKIYLLLQTVITGEVQVSWALWFGTFSATVPGLPVWPGRAVRTPYQWWAAICKWCPLRPSSVAQWREVTHNCNQCVQLAG